MARYTGPKCRLCRREGAKLFLKGVRCESEKCGLTRRMSAPGVHGTAYKRKPSEFGVQLREKQKTKRIYGILEKQFRKYYEAASKKVGVTGEYLLETLERRLDNTVYRSGVAVSRAQARKLITEGRFLLNGKKVNIPSILVVAKDIVAPNGWEFVANKDRESAVWIKVTANKVTVLDTPKREDIKEDINEQLIVEFYSR